MTIFLKDIFPIDDPENYKVHFARKDTAGYEPLDLWVRDRDEWKKKQEWRPKHDEFNRQYIFSLMRFYPESETWLFGGVFEVLERHEDRYEVKLTTFGEGFIGRLKIKSPYKERATRPNMERYYDEFEVKEILSEPYSVRSFPGYEEIVLFFYELEHLVKNDRSDWKTALENVNGVYLLTDTKTNKGYVGAAWGENGIWSRWAEYIKTGHGEDKAIKDLIDENGLEYARRYFRFALLECKLFKTPQDKIQSREKYWKDILDTRGEGGLNRN